MATPLVVGIDGSESSLGSVDWAAAEAARHSLSLHLVHAAAGDHEPSDVISAGRYVFALVLGSRELGDSAHMLLGAVSLAVAARADCPVVVVHGAAAHRNGRFGNIVDGVEEGEGSGAALQFALRGAPVRSCRLTAVDAWNPSCMALTSRPAPSWNALEAQRRTPSQVLDDALRGMTQRYRDARVSPQVFGCPARRALLDAASADLLIVGAGRRTWAPGAVPGSHRSRATASRAVTRRCRSPDMTDGTAASRAGPLRLPVDGAESRPDWDLRPCVPIPPPFDGGSRW
ncbi:universal stress protein [Streptomyces canus]|uniref:universal stress protein n=1 Tax=Streptomyces canus TaxID=58343 RepID=UPI002E2C80F8|nr:universal stress protein [Streptomyces canus]